MIDAPDAFVDEYGTTHDRGEELGRGGQGVVFRTRDPDVAVKLAAEGDGQRTSPENYRAKLRAIRMLPIPPGLQLSMPVAILRDRAGYAMRLLGDMVPFEHFLEQASHTDIPAWLAGASPDEAGKLLHYAATGGLRRRLLALYKAAAILARLHAAGLVYGDVSLKNAYVSSDPASREVWLIDADNLRFETADRNSGVWTPKLGAPELVQGRDGCSWRTDCHSFAAMAFWILAYLHPFEGDHVEGGDDCDWADDDAAQTDPYEQAYAGLLPWVDDEDEDLNATSKGLPRLLILTPRLRRPESPMDGEAVWNWVRELSADASAPIVIPRRLFHPFRLADGDQDLLEVILEEEGVTFCCCHSADEPQLAAALRGDDLSAFREFAAMAKLSEPARRSGFSVLSKGTGPRRVDFVFEEVAS